MIVWNKRFDGSSLKGYLDGYVMVDGLRNYKKMCEYCLFYTFQDETGLSIILKNPAFYGLQGYFHTERKKINATCLMLDELMGIKASYCYWEKPTTHPYRIPDEKNYKILHEKYNGIAFCREYESLRQEYESLRYTFNNQKTHHAVWDYEIAERQAHITPKPVDMMENIILHSSNAGDTVLDCFMGSGSTGVACVNTGRNFIGIELDETYFKIAKDRIEREAAQTRMKVDA
jgi:site-specific DNA-methyltransferase (adenine-specific)